MAYTLHCTQDRLGIKVDTVLASSAVRPCTRKSRLCQGRLSGHNKSRPLSFRDQAMAITNFGRSQSVKS